MAELSVKDGLTAMEVASYLRRNPEFLNEFPDLALALVLPREQGSAASLASYAQPIVETPSCLPTHIAPPPGSNGGKRSLRC